MTTIKISIAMATYNGAQYIQEQLDSLAEQTLLPYELVICDDGSSDDTLTIIREFAKTASFPVHLYQNETNLGFADNFLMAASRCKGGWIGFCDQDDVWFKNKLHTMTIAIDANGANDLMLVVHSAQLVSDNLSIKPGRLPHFRNNQIVRRLGNKGFFIIPGFAIVFKADLIHQFYWHNRPTHVHPPKRMQTHDTWICFLANILGETFCISESLAYYRRHESSLTGLYEPLGIKTRLDIAQSVGSEHYRFISGCAHESADILSQLFAACDDAERKKRLSAGIDKYMTLSHVCMLRARIYDEIGLKAKIITFTKLLLKGGYFGDHFYAFGFLSFLKDIHHWFTNESSKKSTLVQ